ncbi:hypothetical protein MMC25_007322 [Agyrium rufum]|nr:hypothetical protein [Agyrium rufum]
MQENSGSPHTEPTYSGQARHDIETLETQIDQWKTLARSEAQRREEMEGLMEIKKRQAEAIAIDEQQKRTYWQKQALDNESRCTSLEEQLRDIQKRLKEQETERQRMQYHLRKAVAVGHTLKKRALFSETALRDITLTLKRVGIESA